ncbi:unnamed protein product [Spodoptera exigua]|nr:unnamed protein product [Spodoptera exigua]
MDHEELLRILEGVDDGIEIESASDSEIEDEFEAVLTENLPASNPPNVQDESDVVENIPGPPPIQWTRQPFGIETPFFDDFGSGISPSLNLTSSSNQLAVFEKFVDEEYFDIAHLESVKSSLKQSVCLRDQNSSGSPIRVY